MNPFEKQNLIPCVVQSLIDGQVLMLAYLNETAYKQTLDSGVLTFYSRSRQKLWVKGETSGNRLTLQKLTWDCDKDTLLAQVLPSGPVCHLDDHTCFDRPAVMDNTVLGRLYECILDRKKAPKLGAYTTYLLDSGLDKILKKIGEESSEVIIAAKNSDNDNLLGEVADLIYHLWVLLVERDLSPEDVYEVLRSREKA